MNIHGAEITLGKLFSDDYVFEIPGFQRPYRWEIEDAELLFGDLLEASREVDLSSDERSSTYFIGSVVLIKQEHRPQAQIIDGQQRITTLSLLFAALRDTVASSGLAESLEKRLVTQGDEAMDTPSSPRLTVKADVRGFYSTYVLRKGGTKLDGIRYEKELDNVSAVHMCDNLYELRVLCESIGEEERQNLIKFCLQNCLLVVVTAPDLDSAFRIFKVLNDRGMSLSTADILKADLIAEMNMDEQEECSLLWESAENEVGEAGFEELLEHIRMMHRGRTVSNLRDELNRYVIADIGEREFIENLVGQYADILVEVEESAVSVSSHSDQINMFLGFLNMLPFKEWKAAAMLAVCELRDSPDDLLSCIRCIESVASSLFVRRVPRDKKARRLYMIIECIEAGAKLSKCALSSAELLETEEALRGPVYKIPGAARFLLAKLEFILSDGVVETFKWNRISVEHVMPQKISGQVEWESVVDTETHARVVHMLGNLVLLSRKTNSAARNWSFEDKKAKYFSPRRGGAPFVTTSWVNAQSSWDPESIESRTEDLIDQLREHWA